MGGKGLLRQRRELHRAGQLERANDCQVRNTAARGDPAGKGSGG